MKQGEIYLVKFPFTDLTSTKLRPAVVVSNSQFNHHDNLLLVGVFGNKGIHSYSIPLTNNELKEGTLNKISYLRFQNLFSLHKGLLIKKIGVLDPSYLEKVTEKMRSFISIED